MLSLMSATADTSHTIDQMCNVAYISNAFEMHTYYQGSKLKGARGTLNVLRAL